MLESGIVRVVARPGKFHGPMVSVSLQTGCANKGWVQIWSREAKDTNRLSF